MPHHDKPINTVKRWLLQKFVHVSFPAAQADGPQRVYNSAPKEGSAQALDEAPDSIQVLSYLIKGEWNNPFVSWWFNHCDNINLMFVTESPT